MAEKTAELRNKDPDLAEALRRKWSLGRPGYTITPVFDPGRVDAATARLGNASENSVAALQAFVAANAKFVGGLKAGGAIDCAILAEHQREIYGQILTFHLHAAQTVSAMLEIQDAVKLEQVCLPDPCGYPVFTPSAGPAQAEAKSQERRRTKDASSASAE